MGCRVKFCLRKAFSDNKASVLHGNMLCSLFACLGDEIKKPCSFGARLFGVYAR
jgi:hypothetical protein